MPDQTIDEAMMQMSPGERERWCGANICACIGAANCTGGLTAKGFTEADWLDWKKRRGDFRESYAEYMARMNRQE